MLKPNNIEYYFLSTVPLIYGLLVLPSNETANIFVTPRLVLLGCVVFIGLLLRYTGRPRHSVSEFLHGISRQPSYVWWLTLFGFTTVISTMTSVSEGISWFGTPSNQAGTIFILLSIIVFLLYSTAERVSIFGLVVLIVIINLLVIFEYMGFRPLNGIVERYLTLTSPFPSVTIGHRGHLAGLLLIFSLMPLYWFRKNYNSWQFWVIFTLSCTALSCTTNSAAIIAIIASLILFIIFHLGKLNLYILIIPLVGLLSLSLYKPLGVANVYFHSIGWVDATADAKNIRSTTTLETRFILWKSAYLLFKERPLLGWGPQTYNQLWYTHISDKDGDRLFRLELGLQPHQKMVRINDSAAYKDLDDKTVPVLLNYFAPHNSLLDILYSQGLTGVLIFGIFIISLTRYLYKCVKASAFLSLLPFIAYGIYLLAWFVTVPVTGLAAILLGVHVANIKSGQDV
ncbi:O-antigen ligase family protein [Deinococcus sp. SDU3-2]|uniref:O-antigen ligase family protein n=1 Tax=Deinococcus terrestris TaxID=2651870 RepID=A0A7X1TSF3_9DEIO|nr:O-antigen ligase family protein [Deinococcus terrestris]MPY67404.1 O-antigen ligase family protein [Deinococcus terrestris]